MKIAYLSLQQVAEGLDTWAAVNEVVTGLRDEGLEVDVFFPAYRPTLEPPSPHARLGEMLRVQRRLLQVLDDYDAVYVRAHPLAAWAAWQTHKRGVPVVQECNGKIDDLFVAYPVTRLFAPVFSWMQGNQYGWAESVVCVTPELADWVHRVARGARTVIVPNGVNTEVFCDVAARHPGLPDDYAVFFGNFAPWQGIGVLIEALEDEAWPHDLPVVFVGDGVMRPDVERAQQRHPDLVHYVGHVPYERMSSIVANARMSIVPIYSPARADAGFSPLKLYESMSCGTPVVVADTGGLGEIVKRYECGVSFAVADPHALACAVAELHASDDRRDDAARKARLAAVSECSWRARAAARAEVLREVAKA